MPETNKLALLSMLEAIEKIEKFSADLHNWQDLKNDVESFDACLMNFLVIGEMVLRLEPTFIDKHKQIEWHKIRAFRNLVAHEYFWYRCRRGMGHYTQQNPSVENIY